MSRVLRLAFLPLSLTVIGLAFVTVPLPVFLERPGLTVSLADRVTVDAPDAERVRGDFLLTAVNLERGTPARTLYGWLDDDIAIIPAELVVPQGIRDDTYFEGQRELFASTADIAAAVGLAAAGYDVDPTAVTGDGARVVRVLEGAPADGALDVGDVIVAVDGRRVATSRALFEAVSGDDAPEGERTFRVVRGDREIEVALTPRPLTEAVPQIGVQTETVDPRIELPVEVEVDSGTVGGPSAGLLIGLAVLDIVDPDRDLAAGRVVAGTGALDPDGTVGQIGGVAHKVAAALREGAEVFLVPRGQADQARGAVPEGTDLEILAVETFDQAVAALEARR